MTVYQGRLLDPNQDEREIYPYRRVWGSLIVEHVILFAVAAAIFAFSNLLGIELPTSITSAASIGFVALPVVLWAIFSVFRERSARQPRQRLFVIFFLSGLAANAVALPVINDFLQPHKWLPLENAINRIVGYTLSVGIIQEVTKYLVLRYGVWNDLLRTRLDAVAYSVAAALGFATVLNIHLLLTSPALPLDVLAFHVAQNVAINVSASLFVSLGLAETRFDHPTPFFMTITVALAALITGLSEPVLSGLVNAAFSIRGTFARPLLGFGFAIALFAVSIFITAFLYSAAERREQERAVDDGRR